MKKFIKTLYLAFGLLTAGACSPAIAQNTLAKTNETTVVKDSEGAIQKRLADLKQQLNLKSNQQTPWETFSNALMTQAKVQAQAREKLKATIGRDFESKPTPEKMQMMASMMRTSADNLSKAAADTKIFYDVLSPDQKTIFNLFAKDTWNGRMREHIRHGGY